MLTMTFFEKNCGRKTLLIEMMKRFDPSTDLDIVCSLLFLIPCLYYTTPLRFRFGDKPNCIVSRIQNLFLSLRS